MIWKFILLLYTKGGSFCVDKLKNTHLLCSVWCSLCQTWDSVPLKGTVCILLSQGCMELPLPIFPSGFLKGLGVVCCPSAAKHICLILFLYDVYCWCLYYGHIFSLWKGLHVPLCTFFPQSCLASRLFLHRQHFFNIKLYV